MTSRKLLVLIIPLILFNGTALAISEATFLFLAIPPSPQANGMAGVYTSMGNDDPLAPLSIPSVIGLMGERTKAQAAFYLNDAEHIPQYYIDGITYSSRSLFVGFNRNWIRKHLGWKTPLSFGVGYYETNLDLGNTERTDEHGNVLGSFHSEENSKGIGLGVGWHTNKWQAGFGIINKWGHSKLSPFGAGSDPMSAEADAYITDMGLLFRVPFMDWFKPSRCELENRDRLTPFFTPELGYELLNFGGEVSYINRVQGDPLPRIGKLHFGTTLGLDIHSEKLPRPLKLFVFNWGRSSEDILIDRDLYGHYTYKDLFAEIKPLSDLAGNTNDNAIRRTGWEIGFLETFYYREGRLENAPDELYLDSKGVGCQVSGLFAFLSTTSLAKQHSAFKYLFQHIDIQYQQSTRFNIYPRHHYPYSQNQDAEDEQISLYFRY